MLSRLQRRGRHPHFVGVSSGRDNAVTDLQCR
jgi:hypothetical protein